MARPLRLEYPGAVYHITSRGNAREDIFLSSEDRRLFLTILSLTVGCFNFLCHAYCLMGNHYHLIIETPEGNLSKGMRHLNGLYTQRFNKVNHRVGHVFQGRYKAILVEKESHLLSLSRYIVLNPVRARLVESPEDYEWSSYLETAGFRKPAKYLSVDWILAQFAKEKSTAQKRYREFVLSSEEENPWDSVKGQIFLGSEAFMGELKERLWGKENIKEIPRNQRYLARPSLGKLFGSKELSGKQQRNQIIREAALKYGYTLKEIADFLGLHYTTISKVIKR
ncbi:MAG: transposase [Actinomycetota bacterium]|nr:transposase [Actinomycetota bacterium]